MLRDRRFGLAMATARKCFRACGLGTDERLVLPALADRLSRRETIPHQVAFAGELGMSPRRLSTAIARLSRTHGLVFVQRRGPAAAKYVIDWDELEAWLGEDLERFAGSDVD